MSDVSANHIRFITYPLTAAPDPFVITLVDVFRARAMEIAPAASVDRFGSDRVLSELAIDLQKLGFSVEQGKRVSERINRPVFFGENGVPTLNYQVDAYHSEWRCGLEVEAGRGILGGAFYRDIIQGMVMTGVDHLVIAVLNCYQPTKAKSLDFDKCCAIANAIYGHDRVNLPFRLTIVGYGPHLT